MKLAEGIEKLSLAEDEIGGAYPPLGFKPVLEAEGGNGDYFGLYWPYGREGQEPIVCDMLHDEWAIEVAFSRLSVFLRWLDSNDWTRGDVPVEDPLLVTTRFRKMKALVQDDPAEVIPNLQAICTDFPECSEYWFFLARQLRRIGDHEGSAEAAIRTFASNWAFGMPPHGTLRMLHNAKKSNRLANDPLVARSSELRMKWGGAKENTDYYILKSCIGEYLSSETPVLGLLLNQNYGYMMETETVAFQERYGFDSSSWIQEHSDLCSKHLGDSRRETS